MQSRTQQSPNALDLCTCLLLGLTCGATLKRFACLTMTLGQIPTPVAANHHNLTVLIAHHSTSSLDPHKL